MGNHVVCVDVDPRKIEMLQHGEIPIHEPGLEVLVRRNAAAGRLQFTMDTAAAVAHGTLQVIGVDTAPDEDGSADLQYVLAVARPIGRLMTDYKVVIDNSTVPVGTADQVRAAIADELAQRGTPMEYAVVCNPEFLKEGAAIEDFIKPDRFVVGSDDERATLLMRALDAPLMRNHDRLVVMDVKSAEFTKYAANAMLATRISFMNELARPADEVGADIEWVRKGIGSDPRIGTHFPYPGTGYGGSCFPKDVKALIRTARDHGVPLRVLQAVVDANEEQKAILVERVVQRFGDDLAGRSFALGVRPSSPTPTTCAKRPAAWSLPSCSGAAPRCASTTP
jgi:UDPglucose 6-dehydrogenase